MEEKTKLGLGGGLAERVALCLRNEWNAAKIQSRARFSMYENNNTNKEDHSVDSENNESSRVKKEPKEEVCSRSLQHISIFVTRSCK